MAKFVFGKNGIMSNDPAKLLDRLSAKMKGNVSSDNVDPDVCCYYRPGATGHGSFISCLPVAIGEVRATQAWKGIDKFIVGARPDDCFGQLRLPPQGSPKDTLESCEWVPNAWKKQRNPHLLGTAGAPWI